MKIVVVGTGPAAFGALNGLLEYSGEVRPEIIIIGPDADAATPEIGTRDPRDWPISEMAELHQRIRQTSVSAFPPPRTHFGTALGSWTKNGAPQLPRSSLFGGLGDFWSCGMFAFSNADIEDWSIGREDLEPYYRQIAAVVGIAGADDGLTSTYGDGELINRPPLVQSDITRRLVAAVGEQITTTRYIVRAGHNRLAVETRAENESSCVRCGACMYGCFRDALFTIGPRLRRLIKKAAIVHRPGRVVAVSSSDTRPSARLADGTTIDADRIILCAGAIGSTAVLLRSLGSRRRVAFVDDNENYLFPIIATGRSGNDDDGYFAFGEATLWFTPRSNEGRPAQASIAPMFDYLFDFYLPRGMIGAGRGVARKLRRRFLLARLHIDGATATRYALSLSSTDELRIQRKRVGASDFRARAVIASLKQALRGRGFRLPPFPLLRASTSAHFCGGFARPTEHTGDPARGPVMPGIWLADSAAFPRLPAQAPTYTIMAFAMRAARQALAA